MEGIEMRVSEFIKKAIGYIRDNGYDKSTTSEYIINNYDSIESVSDDDMFEFIVWASGKKGNDYFNNLSDIIRMNKELSEKWQYNTVASGINIFFKNKKSQAEGSSSSFQGTVGEDITFTIKSHRAIAYDSYGGTFYRIVGIDNNIYMWSTSKYFEDGDTIKAKVADHREYQGEKQTVVRRGKVINRVGAPID